MVTIRTGYSRAVAPCFVLNVQGLATYANDFVVTWYSSHVRLIGKLLVDQNALRDFARSWINGVRRQVLNTPDGAGVFLGW